MSPPSSSLYSPLLPSLPAFPPTEIFSTRSRFFSLSPSCLIFLFFFSFTLSISPLTNKQVSREQLLPLRLRAARRGHRPVWPRWRSEPRRDWLGPRDCSEEGLRVADRHSVSETKTQGVLPAAVPQG